MRDKRFLWGLGAALLGATLVVMPPAATWVDAAVDVSGPVFVELSSSPAELDLLADPTVTVTATITDDVSGVFTAYAMFRSPSGQELIVVLYRTGGDTWQGSNTLDPWTAEVGRWTLVSMYARDVASNVTELVGDAIVDAGFRAEFTVRTGQTSYEVVAFAAPIDNGVVNIAKAGRTIPVKWHASLDGANVTDPAHFVSVTSTSCSAAGVPADSDVIEFYSVQSGLQYLGDGWWQFNWKVPKIYAEQCRVMTLTLDDESTYGVTFTFR